MAPKKKRIKLFIIILFFLVYFLIAARPIPRETILSFNWLTTLPSGTIRVDFPVPHDAPEAEFNNTIVSGRLLPFILDSSFGYIDFSGNYALNQIRTDDIYLSPKMWTKYNAEPANIEINNIVENTIITIENARGYPVLLDDRIFILGSDQNSLSEIDSNGNIKWTYEFGAPLTSIDAAAGLVLTGSLDGVIEVFNSSGERIFYFETGGSRYSVILGVAISRDGSHIGVICGIDPQRFLLFERFGESGDDYKVVHHEFLDTGFRHPVRILFIDEDRRIVFEREGGISCYSIRSRRGMFIPLDGQIVAIDESGDKGFFFLITAHPNQQKKLIGIKFPHDRLFGASRTAALDSIFMKASFKSDDVFLGRTRTEGSRNLDYGSMLIIGGGNILISFNIEEK